jgi:hypothetical protein
MATALDQATRDAYWAQADDQAKRLGISREQGLYNIARANNVGNADVDTLMGFGAGTTDNWLKQRDAGMSAQALYAGLNNNSNASDIANAYRQWSSATGGDTTENQRAAESYLQSLGIGSGAIKDAYTAYKAPQPLYAGLNNNSNANDIAAAYREWSGSNGGDTTENQRAAEGYLSNLGIGSGAIRDAYTAYKGQQQPQQPQQQPQNLGIGGSYNPQQNPYLGQMGRDIGSQMFDNWSRTQMPSIRSGAMAAGGFGGSRQGVVEANGMNDMNRQYGQALTSMYGNDWSQQQGRNLQQQGLNNSYDLGLRSSDLGFANLDANINQNNFGNQMQAANFGMGVYGMMNGMNQQGINSGTQMQNTPLDYQKYFTNSANATGGMGGTQTGTVGSSSNPTMQGLGLYQYGSQNGGGMNNIGGADFTKYLMNGTM